jgi:death-on-curing protein
MNGFRLTLTNEEAFDLVMAVAAGEVDDVQALAVRLAATTQRR